MTVWRLVVVMCLVAGSARAASLVPPVTIEAIEVTGNEWTGEHLVRRALLVAVGDELTATDQRFDRSRHRVMGLGYFSEVELRLEKGTERGRVVLVVQVVERGTFLLHQLYLGTSEATPVWAGLDVGNTNFFGTGTTVSGAVLWAAEGDVPGARSQLGLRLRYADPALLDSVLGTRASLLYNRASEPVKRSGPPEGSDPAQFGAVNHSRIGGSAGVTLPFTRMSRWLLDGRLESVDVENDAPDDFGLGRGRHTLIGGGATWVHDTRSDPILPTGGARLVVAGQVVSVGGEPSFFTVRSSYSHYVAVAGSDHVVAVHLGAGLIVGTAPRFERFHIGDWNRLVTPRALDLVLSTQASRDFLGTEITRFRVGNVAASAQLEYSYRLFRAGGFVYGANLFAAGGLVGLADRDAIDSAPVDLVGDVGLRLDTEIGVFELAVGNALGRVPL